MLALVLQAAGGLQQLTPRIRSSRRNPFRKNVSPLNVAPEVAAGAFVLLGGGAALLWFSGAEERDKRAQYAEWESEEREYQDERARRANVDPRDTWEETDLAQYDGTRDEDGPILFAADGIVFNVWRGRHFYGPGCEYHIFAGKDASRLLAKSKLEEETPEEALVSLNIGERAALATWVYTFKSKYDVVGKLEGFDPGTTALI